MIHIAPIVEGHGEVRAVPALIHRISAEVSVGSGVRINAPIRVSSGSFLSNEAYFRKYVTLAAAKAAQARGIVLILLDCDDECAATLAPGILERAIAVRKDVHHLVAFAVREYETWFLAAARSLRGVHGLSPDLEVPANPEAIRDAKGWLSVRMTGGYDPVIHQEELTKALDIGDARSSRSFSRFFDRLCEVLVASP